jgi:hypothetical protein
MKKGVHDAAAISNGYIEREKILGNEQELLMQLVPVTVLSTVGRLSGFPRFGAVS